MPPLADFQMPLALFAVFILGFVLSKRGISHRQVAKVLSSCLTFIFYPSLIFASITKFSDTTLRASILKTMLLTVLILVLGRILGRLWIARYGPLETSVEQTNRFMLTMPNYIFLPLPIATYLYGDAAAALVIVGALAADVFMWLVAIPTLAQGRILGRYLFNPPIIAGVFALLLAKNVVSVSPAKAGNLLKWTDKVGAGAVPVAMYILGHYIAGSSFRLKADASAAFVTLTRLIFVPLCAFFPIFYLTNEGIRQDVLLLVSTMPAAIAALVIGPSFGADIYTARRQVMSTHFFALMTVPAWLFLLHPLLKRLLNSF